MDLVQPSAIRKEQNYQAMAFPIREGLNQSILDFSDHANRNVRFSMCFIFQQLIVVEKWRHIPVPRKL
jgi:hypothetical protein